MRRGLCTHRSAAATLLSVLAATGALAQAELPSGAMSNAAIAVAEPAPPVAAEPVPPAGAAGVEAARAIFLDRRVHAESSGRDFTATGALAQAELPSSAMSNAAIAVAEPAPPVAAEPVPPAGAAGVEATLAIFLDRLMHAESSGRDFAANPRSTALGPFQFIKATFLEVARKHFASEIAQLTEEQILALRTNRAFARRAAEAYTRDSADYLSQNGQTPTFVNLRLAFLVGPAGALRLLRAPEQTPGSQI
ncbi:MAG: hypothetical protein ACREC6_10500, partial [Hyphomicrobiaceae bacterium]